MLDASEKLIQQIKRHEGVKLKPYKCTAGKLTIGVGRNLEDVGISEREAEFLLMNDLQRVIDQARAYSWYDKLNDPRKAVVLNMIFNMGAGGFSKFKKTHQLIEEGDFAEASIEMLDSRWSDMVGRRAIELSRQMDTGEWQD